VEIIVVPAGPDVITGQSLSLSRIGVGSVDIGGRSSILYRADVVVRSTGDAEVTLRRTGGSVTFSGKLVAFDQNMLRIAVQNSGAANAGGEFEIGYSGRNMTSIGTRDLVLDGQNVTVRF
jgi:hypothetical protein